MLLSSNFAGRPLQNQMCIWQLMKALKSRQDALKWLTEAQTSIFQAFFHMASS